MFKTMKKEKFSFRKYKNGRTDSKLIGAAILTLGLFASVGANAVSADAVNNKGEAAVLVTDTSKVASTSATIFKDDQDSTKNLKVDAVLEKGITEPTKVNDSVGEADGVDTVSFKSEATVNYKLDSDKSLLKSEKVEAGTGAVTTPYDKKGLAYDTDGKAYRESTVTKIGDLITEATGKKDTVEANGKTYEYLRSEVENGDTFTYNKTRFNDIEVAVSPEGMQNKLGEIDYTKAKGKIYLVEETADGQYGKYVVADSGVSNKEDAVAKWRAGQTDAKDFSKENVTLQEGDTILVLDKDTYATGKGTETVTKIYVLYYPEEEGIPPQDAERTVSANEMIDGSVDYKSSLSKITEESSIKNAATDKTLGTQDDFSELAKDYTILKYDTSKKQENKEYVVTNIPEGSTGSSTGDAYTKVGILPYTSKLDVEKATMVDHLKDVTSLQFRIIDFLEVASSIDDNSVKLKIQEKKKELNHYIEELAEYAKSNGINFGLLNKELVFYHADIKKLEAFQTKVAETKNILNGLDTDLDYFKRVQDDEYTYTGHLSYNSSTSTLLSGSVTIAYHRPSSGRYTPAREERTVISNETNELAKLDLKGSVSIADNTVKLSNTATTEVDSTETEVRKDITYVAKELIAPVRAYKVMNADAKAVVTHYYKEKAAEIKESHSELKGSVIIKYVDQNGTVIAPDTVVANDVVVANVTKLVQGDKEEAIFKPTKSKYKAVPETTLTIDGLPFVLKRIVPVSDKWTNSIEEEGFVKEGITTLVYEYKLNIEATATASTEFDGGVNPLNPPVAETPEYNEPIGAVPNNAPVLDIPEFNGGVNPLDPPVLEIPEAKIPVTLAPIEYIKDQPRAKTPNKKEEPKVEVIPADFTTPKQMEVPKTEVVTTGQSTTPKVEVVAKVQKAELPYTGTESNTALTLAGISLALLGVSIKLRKEN